MSDVFERRDGFVRCVIPVSAGAPFTLAHEIEGIRISFARQGLHEFDETDLVIERHDGALDNVRGMVLDAVIALHPTRTACRPLPTP